jgi:hypothetical protein
MDIGKLNSQFGEHEIQTGNAASIIQRPRRTPTAFQRLKKGRPTACHGVARLKTKTETKGNEVLQEENGRNSSEILEKWEYRFPKEEIHDIQINVRHSHMMS